MARDSVSHTLLVASVLCVVCSVLVAGAAVGLRGTQETNKLLDQKKNVLIAAGLLGDQDPTAENIDRIFAESVERVIVDLDTGEIASPSEVDPKTFDQREAARDPTRSEPVEPADGLGGIKRREKYSFVYLVRGEGGGIEKVVLPMYGKGLWSTLYGFLAVSADGKTVEGITFYEHGETPGLGGEIENVPWQKSWQGKELHNAQGEVVIRVIKGSVDPEASGSEHKIDGLSGATITSNGVTNLVQYWMGPEGFGPYLDKLSGGRGTENG
jgi:Na+-transporting NADH:ubiquinone oxidoreductase subunit C